MKFLVILLVYNCNNYFLVFFLKKGELLMIGLFCIIYFLFSIDVIKIKSLKYFVNMYGKV